MPVRPWLGSPDGQFTEGVRDLELDGVGRPVEPDLDGFGRVAVAKRVRERLLQDPVDGEGLRRVEFWPLAEFVDGDGESGIPHLLDEPVEVGEPRLRTNLLRVAQLPEQQPHVGERLARGRRDRGEGVGRRDRILRVARAVGLRDHDRERVRDDVVHVAGEPVALLLDHDGALRDLRGDASLARVAPACARAGRGSRRARTAPRDATNTKRIGSRYDGIRAPNTSAPRHRRWEERDDVTTDPEQQRQHHRVDA